MEKIFCFPKGAIGIAGESHMQQSKPSISALRGACPERSRGASAGMTRCMNHWSSWRALSSFRQRMTVATPKNFR